MVKGLEDNPKVPEYITEDFRKYQKSKKWNRFEWNESIPKNEMFTLSRNLILLSLVRDSGATYKSLVFPALTSLFTFSVFALLRDEFK